jgi:hypothetical protein
MPTALTSPPLRAGGLVAVLEIIGEFGVEFRARAGQLASFFSHFLRILTSIPRPYPLAHRMGRWTKQAGTDCLSQERFSDPLTEVLRDGARALLAVGPTP